jgi:hypothetical protein
MPDPATSSAGGLLGTLYIKFTAQTDELNSKVEESEKKVVKSTEHMAHAAEFLKSTLETLGVVWGLSEIVAFAKETIHAADEIKKLSAELGLSIDKVAGLKFAADKANIGDSLEQGMRKFAMGFREAQVQGSEMAHLFEDLGVDVSHGMDKAFDQVADQLGQMQDGVNKTGLAQELFGVRQARFVNLFSQGAAGIKKDAMELAKVTGMSYDEAAKKSEEFKEATVTLTYAFRGMAMSVLNELLPPIVEFINWVSQTAVPAIKEFFGEVATGFTEAGGLDVWEQFVDLLKEAWGYITNTTEALGGMQSIAQTLGVVLATVMMTIRDLFKYALEGIKFVGMGVLGLLELLMKTGRWIAEKLVVAFEFWANAGIKAINFLIAGFNSMTDKLPDWIKKRLGIEGGEAVTPLELFKLGKPTGLDDWIDIVSDARKDLQDSLAVDFGETAKVIQKGNEKVKEAIKEGKKDLQAVINPAQNKKLHSDLDKLVGTDDMSGATDFRKTLGKLGTFTSGGKTFHTAGTDDMKGMTEASKLLQEKNDIDETLKDIQKIRESHIKISDEQQKRLTDLEAAEIEKRKAMQIQSAHLQLQTASDMFGNLADITKAWAGQQSGVYKAMFAISKAFAIADATVKIAQGIAAAAANPWPLNLFAMASVVAATASIVSSIQAVQLEFGGERALGGPVTTDKAFLVGERGPEMFVPATNGSIIPNNRLGGGPTRVIVNNFSDARPTVTERQQGNEKVMEVLVTKVEERLGSNIRDGRGALNKSLTDSFSLRRGQGNA